MLNRRETLKLGAAGAALLAAPAIVRAQDMPKIVLGMSGWTGFAPLTLAEHAGLFKKNGVDVEIKFIAQPQRHLAMMAGDVQAIATTVDTQIAYTAAGVDLTQVMVIDYSEGGDGIAVRSDINSFADLKGKEVACDGAGTTPYFTLAYMLKQNGMEMSELKLITLSPKDAANAFVAGQYDAAETYEPYLSTIRANPEAGKILATTIEYPCVVDTLAFQPDWIAANKDAVKRTVAGFFDALEMITSEPDKSYEIMGAKVNLSGPDFAELAAYIHWMNQAENQTYMADDLMKFMEVAAEIQLEAGVIREKPDLAAMIDASFVG